ncbi:MAG TPA: serine/threonine-protein kinase [Phycisphaerae bacterium]|nr:serine/threonine-protein kinase [Phycisphaerae bacterium]
MPLSSEKYQRVKDIFLAATEKPVAEQEKVLDELCNGDEEIRREVESLLKEHSRGEQLIPSEPAGPLGSMSAILSRANIELPSGDPASRRHGEETVRREPTSYLDDSSATPSGSGSGFVDAGRFMAGTIVAGRYRIIELLGRGGMGEVYRADDLALNASIAMKFLPPLFGADAKWLERLKNEVRVARQVTHPNVCRVFDLGEFQGEQFITMEYVDGENLASLLRRIGRVPDDKGLQIARQLCAGLAAAHDRGVLHRDLKPANVMIDGRGAVRITDFGLAAPADQLRTNGAIRAGTPAYMSPEQLNGRPVTVRSDIYSLGLVLYEMFTGRRAFKADNLREYQRLHTREEPTPPHEIVDDIDPIVERVILRCLEKDPRNRPATAIAVAAGLPGGNPLREILAAGETPSPEVVAAAGEASGGLKPRTATGFLVAALLAMIAVVMLSPQAFLVQQVVKDKPPAVLADRAKTVLASLGYREAPRDWEGGFAVDGNFQDHVLATRKDAARWQELTRRRAGLVYYWYRESPELLVPWQAMPVWQSDATARREDDPPLGPGAIDVALDPEGRLIDLEVQASQPPLASPATTQPEVWTKLLAAADLQNAVLTPGAPEAALPVYADTRAAWDAQIPDRPQEHFHVEAAAAGGRPVYFAVKGDWPEPAAPTNVNRIIQTVLSLVLLVAGGLLAHRHYRSGRGDRHGATRMAGAIMLFGFTAWALRAHHVPNLVLEFRMFRQSMGAVMYWVVLVWVFYLALEPYVRRVWPEVVISWSRLLAGRWIDPLVGRDALVGCCAGAITAMLSDLELVLPRWLHLPAPLPAINGSLVRLESLTDGATMFTAILGAVYVGLLMLLLLVVLRMAFRRRLFAALGFVAVIFAATGRWNPIEPVGIPLQLIISAIFLAVMVRNGLVALVFCLLVRNYLDDFPITADWGVWFGWSVVVPLAVISVLLLASFYASIGGRPLISIRLADR